MLKTHEITESINVQTFTVGALNLVLRAVEAAEDTAPRIRAAVVAMVPAVLFACATLLRALAWLVDFTAYVLVGAGRGVVVLALGAVAVVALTLQGVVWAADVCVAVESKRRLVVA